jgi:hypothetical protein
VNLRFGFGYMRLWSVGEEEVTSDGGTLHGEGGTLIFGVQMLRRMSTSLLLRTGVSARFDAGRAKNFDPTLEGGDFVGGGGLFFNVGTDWAFPVGAWHHKGPRSQERPRYR